MTPGREEAAPVPRASVSCPNAASAEERIALARWMAGALSRLLAGVSVNERYEGEAQVPQELVS